MSRDDDRSPSDLESLRLIADAALRAKRIVESLLGFSRRPQQDEKGPFDLARVVDDALFLLQSQFKGSRVEVVRDLTPAFGWGNANLVQQVAVNLVVNACDAMPAGGTLTVRTGSAPIDRAVARAHHIAEGDYCTLIVKDTGSGLTPEVQARMFDPFFTTKGNDAGTGLGLTTVQGIVQEAGGCVVVASAPGRGSTFVVYLPQART